MDRIFFVDIQTKIFRWIINFVRWSRTLVAASTLASLWLKVTRWMKRLTLVSSNGWKSCHERCVVLEARWRSPNKRFWGKSIALVPRQIYIFLCVLMLMTQWSVDDLILYCLCMDGMCFCSCSHVDNTTVFFWSR